MNQQLCHSSMLFYVCYLVGHIYPSIFIQMHIFKFAFYGVSLICAIRYEPILLFYFSIFIVGYLIISHFYYGANSIGIKQKMMMAIWTTPSEGNILLNVKVRVDKVLNFLQKYPKQQRPTMTHVVVKIVGQLLHQAPQVNGKLVFGKFFPYPTCNVSCFVDIEQGKDNAVLLIEQVDKKSIEDIRDFVKLYSRKMKRNQGDETHKKRIKPLKEMPVFLIQIVLKLVYFISHKLGISIPFLSIKNDAFGPMCVTSLGMLGYQNATPPIPGFLGSMAVIAINMIKQQPVIENGEIKMGKTMNINLVVDHRYIDGGKAKRFTEVLKSIFINPQQYADGGQKARNNKPPKNLKPEQQQ